jgi:hypothetical protein
MTRITRSLMDLLQYFEQDDPELYISKVKYILDNPVEPMELTFSEEEYSSTGQLLKVVNFNERY